MRQCNASIFLALLVLLPSSAITQDKAEREIDIHKNVRLIEMAIPQDTPEEFKIRYRHFLPLFEEALKENTSDQALENALTFSVAPGIKEIGSAKTKRAIARIIAYRKKSLSQYVGDLLLYSYATDETVGKQEIGQFLTRQILSPLGLS
jgi:hypothetical protein